MTTDTDLNPLSIRQREEIRRKNRGRMVSPGFYRCFCHLCGMPLVTPNLNKAMFRKHECDECGGCDASAMEARQAK